MEFTTKLFYAGKTKLYRDTKQEDSFLQILAEGAIKWASWLSVNYLKGLSSNCPTNQAFWR